METYCSPGRLAGQDASVVKKASPGPIGRFWKIAILEDGSLGRLAGQAASVVKKASPGPTGRVQYSKMAALAGQLARMLA